MKRSIPGLSARNGARDAAAAPTVPPVPLLVTLLSDHEHRRRTASAIGKSAVLVQCETIREARLVLEQRPVAAVLLETTDARGSRTSAFVEQVRRAWPRTALHACVPRAQALAPDAFALVRAGVHDIIFTEHLDLAYVVSRVTGSARRHCLLRAVWPELEPVLDDVLAPFLRFGLDHAFTSLDVKMVAAALGAHRKTIWQHCSQRGLPSPRALLGWCRVLAAAFALDESGRTVDSIAHELDFASPTALRNLIKRYMSLTASGLRARGGSSHVVRCLAEELAPHTAPHTAPRRARAS